MKKDLQYYKNLPWSYLIRKEIEETGSYYFIRVNQLDCYSQGDNLEEAVKNIQEALELHLETCLLEGITINEPLNVANFKGNFSLRTTPEKHYKIVQMSQESGKPVNEILNGVLDRVLGN